MNRRYATVWFVVGLLSGCHSLEHRLLYHPVSGETSGLSVQDNHVHDVFVQSASGDKIHARWCPHPEGKGAILYCPGNGGNLESRGALVSALWRTQGESVLIVDYPGYGLSQGKPSEPGCYAAAEAAYRWLTETQQIPPQNIVLYGESLGGGVAVNLASRLPHRALVLNRTFTSIPDVAEHQLPILPAQWMMTNRFDNLQTIPQCSQPIFIAHATDDRLIPFSHGKKLANVCTAPVQRFVLDGLDHNEMPGHDFYDALREFLQNRAPIR